MAYCDRAVGIDLGTTNSEIAWLLPSEREVVIYADRFGRKTIPSAVAWDDKESAFVVGHLARSRRGTAGAPVESIKRKMGQRVKVALGPHELTPEEISSKILAELKARMQELLAARPPKTGAPDAELRVTRAVITVPAYFDGPQVEATRRAGELAGLEVIGVLQEPTAAAIYHTWRRKLGDGNFLVYDLGGGTFDVSVLRCVGGEYQVLAIDGDNFLGGDDLDRRYAEHLRASLAEKGYALDLDVQANEEHRRIFSRIVHLAQEIKESLSTTEVAHVSKAEFVRDTAGEAVSFEGDVGRADYEAVVGDLVETTISCCERALARSKEIADVGLDDIEHVVLVGGSTRVPLVVRRVTEALCKKAGDPLRDDVDTCVALGAAVHAAHLGGTVLGRDDVRVRVGSPLVSHTPKLKVSLTVEQAPEGASRVGAWEGETALAEAALDGGAARLEVSLGEAEQTNATLAIASKVGVPLAELPIAFFRGDLRPRPTALSRASVVAKDLSLEVVRGGRRERKVLIARGTGLPAQVTHLFFTTDQSGAVVLRVLQARLPIKTLVVEVPKDLPVGSPVEVVLRCDESMRLEAQATVAGQAIDAHIEPPPPEQAAADVEGLLEEAETARKSLWGAMGAHFGQEADRLIAGIREVLRTDPDKLEALCQRLRNLVDEFHGGAVEKMVPPMAKMEEAFDGLRRVVYRAPGDVMGATREAWEKRIDELHDKAHAAHHAGDGPTWRRVFNEVQALLETAYQEEFASMSLDDPAYLRRRVSNVSYWAERVDRALDEFVPSQVDEVRVLQDMELGRLRQAYDASARRQLEALRDRPEGEGTPAEQRRALEKIESELERIETALERLPSVGLVTDRGAGG